MGPILKVIMDTTQTNNNNNKTFEDNKCPICGDSQQLQLSERTALNHHIALCSIYFMRHNQIDVDQMLNLIGGYCQFIHSNSSAIKHQRQINQHYQQQLVLTKTQQELDSLNILPQYDGIPVVIQVGEGKCRLLIDFSRGIYLAVEQVAQVRRIIQQSKLVTYLTVIIRFNNEVLEQASKSFQTHIEQSCQVLTGSPFIKTVKLETGLTRNYNVGVFNQFTLSLPNLECLRLRCDKVEDHLPMVIELLYRNQIKHMTIDCSLSVLQCQQLFNSIKTNKSLISLRISLKAMNGFNLFMRF
ncbi:hypothetical protein DFA_00239 [Cavenderia fasciculata]|uniref:Uncharacterized protein n=1 Tax=Cavenderia fasciculata TaxID=261658 RepID=F4PY01_CACFS|nr:uncharacterized protein DFA_00239 [Cavenderia fasciculata]EGG19661.1 hypothetical protein DFA_00239 [Cavenderia fasciculata]|eukprot:XP_004357955.1 hypothetical protein DFA_00239 [Cavenderia fasciculata]